MNDQLEKFARTSLKRDLAKCSPAERNVFAHMYGGFGINDTINTIVNSMPIDKLDWAMQQVKTTLEKK